MDKHKYTFLTKYFKLKLSGSKQFPQSLKKNKEFDKQCKIYMTMTLHSQNYPNKDKNNIHGIAVAECKKFQTTIIKTIDINLKTNT